MIIQSSCSSDWLRGRPPRPFKPRGVVTFQPLVQDVLIHKYQCAAAAVFGCVHVAALNMSLKTVGTAVTRILLTTGNRTPPLVRSPKVNRLSTTCTLSGEGKQGREKTKSFDSCSARPGEDGRSSCEPPHRSTSADKKRPKEPVGAPGVTGVRRRSFTSATAAPVDKRSYLWSRYNDMKKLVHGKQTVRALCLLHVDIINHPRHQDRTFPASTVLKPLV